MDKAIQVFDTQYRIRGLAAQRTYPNEALIQFIAARWFSRPPEERADIRVLEIGCGSGANLWMLAKEGFDTYGCDGSAEAIRLADIHLRQKWQTQARLEVARFDALPYQDQFFDAVVDVVSLQHTTLLEGRKAFTEIARVLKPTGEFFSYRLSDRSVMFLHGGGDWLDAATVADIADPQMPLAGCGPVSFWSPALARQEYDACGLSITQIDTLTRQYDNRLLAEYLAIAAQLKPSAS